MIPIRKQNPAVRYAVETGGAQILAVFRFDFGTAAETVRWRDRWIAESPATRSPRTHASLAAQIRRVQATHGDSLTWLPEPSPDPNGVPGDVLRLRLNLVKRTPRPLPMVAEIPPALQCLTPAQFRILRTAAETGEATPSLAATLGLVESTVYSQFSAILRKLGALDRADALRAYRDACDPAPKDFLK